MRQIAVRVPPVTSIESAIRIYYENIEIGNQEIIGLFGKIGSDRIVRLKRLAKNQMDEDEIPSWNGLRVNTKSAYKAWGLDITDLEKRYKKLKQLGVGA